MPSISPVVQQDRLPNISDAKEPRKRAIVNSVRFKPYERPECQITKDLQSSFHRPWINSSKVLIDSAEGINKENSIPKGNISMNYIGQSVPEQPNAAHYRDRDGSSSDYNIKKQQSKLNVPELSSLSTTLFGLLSPNQMNTSMTNCTNLNLFDLSWDRSLLTTPGSLFKSTSVSPELHTQRAKSVNLSKYFNKMKQPRKIAFTTKASSISMPSMEMSSNNKLWQIDSLPGQRVQDPLSSIESGNSNRVSSSTSSVLQDIQALNRITPIGHARECQSSIQTNLREHQNNSTESRQTHHTSRPLMSENLLIPLSVQIAFLTQKFTALDKVIHPYSSLKKELSELQLFYELKAAEVESQRFKTLCIHKKQTVGSNLTSDTTNTYYDTLHMSLIRHIETVLATLEIQKECDHYGMIQMTDDYTKNSLLMHQASLHNWATGKDGKMKDGSVSPKKQRTRPELPVKAVDLMLAWYEQNTSYPYPSVKIMEKLASEGGITYTQVRKWFSNRRVRSGYTKNHTGPLNGRRYDPCGKN